MSLATTSSEPLEEAQIIVGFPKRMGLVLDAQLKRLRKTEKVGLLPGLDTENSQE